MNTELTKLNGLMKEMLLDHGSEMPKALREKMCALGIELENSIVKDIEVEIWVESEKLERFRTDFEGMNKCKFQGSEVVKRMGLDIRVALKYRIFSFETNLPEQGYYQLNNIFE